DLTDRTHRAEEIPEATYRKYLGGGALAAHLLLRDLKPGADPLGPDNVLVLMTSVINGLSLSGTNRYTAAAKSPLTGGYGESEAGGWWGPELRAAGWDGVVVHGKADTPTYLWIKDDRIEFRDAGAYWGQLSGEVQDGLAAELGDKRSGVLALEASGILPTRNFRDGSFEGARDISGQKMRDTILVNRGTCYACAVACKREVEVKELGVTPKYGGPEYETLAATGSLCGISDLNALALINQLYAQYVLDSISTGAVIAFAMECYEHGIITPG